MAPHPSEKVLDRNWNELLQELRVTQTGVQVLTAFLLTVPFTNRFAELDDTQRVCYLVVLCGSILTTGLMVAPVAFHRVLFRHRQRRWLVAAGNRCATLGLLVLAATMAGALFLVFDLVTSRVIAVVAFVVCVAFFWLLWLVAPTLADRRSPSLTGPSAGTTRAPDHGPNQEVAMSITEPQKIDDVVDLLKEQHTQLKELLPEVLTCQGNDRQRAFTKVRQLLAVHEALEQVMVHPHAKSDVGSSQVSERVEEEEEASDVIAKLESADIDSDEFHDTYAKFMLDVVEHAEHEEHEEFERIEHEFTEAELAQAAAAVELLQTGPDGTTSFEEMLEAAKDKLSAMA